MKTYIKASRSSVLLGAALLLALGLTACGGSSSPPSFLETTIDSFTKFVTNLVASSPDDQEPQSIDGVAVVAPDDSDTSALK